MKTRQNDIYFKSFQMDKYGFDLDKKITFFRFLFRLYKQNA